LFAFCDCYQRYEDSKHKGFYSSAITRVSLTRNACNAIDENVKAVLYARVGCIVIAETSVKIQGWMTGQIFFF
jgi:hypothetical protein